MYKILVIDDEEQIRKMFSLILENEGYEVDTAEDGKIGCRMFGNKKYDLLITDIVMPEKEGIETIIELKRDYPELKIIVISGGGRISPKSYLNLAKGLGADKTFEKPVQRKDIIEAVRELLSV